MTQPSWPGVSDDPPSRVEQVREGDRYELSEGEAKGLREGEAKGLREGEARGKAEGLREGKVTALRTVLAARGLTLDDALRARQPAVEPHPVSARLDAPARLVVEREPPRGQHGQQRRRLAARLTLAQPLFFALRLALAQPFDANAQ
jgi:hypothetical protein